MPNQQRRKNERLKCGVEGVVTPLFFPTHIDHHQAGHLMQSYKVHIENISARGVFLTRDPALPVGSFLRIDFDLGPSRFHCFGRVVRIAEGKEPSGNGVRLVFVEDDDRLALLKYLAKQLETS